MQTGFSGRSLSRALAAFALSLPLLAAADASTSPQSGPPHGGPHAPPPEAVAACNGLSAAAACSFSGRNGETLTGTCAAPPADKAQASTLACRPDHPPQGRPPMDNGDGPPDGDGPPPDSAQ